MPLVNSGIFLHLQSNEFQRQGLFITHYSGIIGTKINEDFRERGG